MPWGTLDAYPTVVQTGTKPTLTWAIMHPKTITAVVSITSAGELTLLGTNFVTITAVGTGVTACDSTSANLPVDLRFKLNSNGYKQLFYGQNSDVYPSEYLYCKKHFSGDVFNFGGNFVKNGVASPFYTTRSSNLQVVALVNGDTPPTTFSLYQSSTLASYLRPYLDSSGKVAIGALDVLILMELGQTNHSMSCFDYQDAAFLVNFSSNHPNNGHGNNLDGVDSSNPGQGHGGPNGAVDLSAGVDDEIR